MKRTWIWITGVSAFLLAITVLVWFTGDYIFEITTGGRYILISSRNHLGFTVVTDPTRDPHGTVLAKHKGLEIMPGNFQAFVDPNAMKPRLFGYARVKCDPPARMQIAIVPYWFVMLIAGILPATALVIRVIRSLKGKKTESGRTPIRPPAVKGKKHP